MYLSIIQHVTFTVTKVIFKHGFFTLTQVWIWVKDLNTSTFNQSGPRVGSGSACLSCCSLTCPLDGAILKHLTLLLPHKVCRRGNWGNHLNWKQLVKLESHISGVKLFFILTFPDACQRTHTHTLLPARVCVCVCVTDYFGLLLRAHSCHVCLTALCHQIGPVGFLFVFSRTFQELFFPACSCCLWIMNQSDQHRQEATGCGLFMIYCIVKLRLLKYVHFSFHLDARARNRMSASESVEEHISLWENRTTLRCLFIYLNIFNSSN